MSVEKVGVEKMKANPTGPTKFHQGEHYFYRTCDSANCEPVTPRPTDPGGLWAFCNFCAFEVTAEEVDGKVMLLRHDRAVGSGTARQQCAGRGTEATVQPSPEAKPKALWYSLDEEDDDDGIDDDEDEDTTGGD